MAAPHPISALIFTTFGIVLLVLIVAFAYFMRKKSNSQAGDRMPERGEPGAPDAKRGEPISSAHRR